MLTYPKTRIAALAAAVALLSAQFTNVGHGATRAAESLSALHTSMQYSDGPARTRSDAKSIFHKANRISAAWITGTEMGENDRFSALSDEARKAGYSIHRLRSNWIAVDRSIVKPGSLSVGGHIVAKAAQVAGPGHDTCFLWVTFTHRNPAIGKVSVIASHYPTRGRPGVAGEYGKNQQWTRKAAVEISKRAKVLGKGNALVFYGGDQNIPDNQYDTFYGRPLTSTWDELSHWPNTGHGNIDLIASYDYDARVRATRARAFSDRMWPLFTDHYAIMSTFSIKAI